MKKKLIIILTLLTFIITACGGQPTQTPPEPAIPTKAVTQPTPVLTVASVATDATIPSIDAATLATEAPVAGVSFANDVMPILGNSCNNCHGIDQVKEGLDMQTYESLMAGSFNGPVIVTGNSAESLLVQLVSEGKMPKRGPKLTSEQIQIISEWIDAGALNN
jgi:mono/diheme cytochrome c family protein